MHVTFFSVRVVVVVPLIVQALTNIRILYKISKLRGTDRKRVCKSVKTITVTIGTFYVCMTPVNVWLAMSLFPGYSIAGMYKFFATQLAVANSGTSFFIYFSTLENFRDKFLTIAGCKKRNRIDSIR